MAVSCIKAIRDGFQSSGVMQSLAHSGAVESTGRDEGEAVVRETNEELLLGEKDDGGGSSTPNTEIPSENDPLGGVTSVDESPAQKKKGPRKLVEEEARAVGRVGRTVWETYFKACGGSFALAYLRPRVCARSCEPDRRKWLAEVCLSSGVVMLEY
jgi:hypothetical protein